MAARGQQTFGALTEARRLDRRRLVFFSLVAATCVAMLAMLAKVFGRDGISVVDALMLAAFAVTLPWNVIGFWNAVIGLAVALTQSEPLRFVAPLAGLDGPDARSASRTAIVVPVYDEDPEMVLGHLEATIIDLSGRSGNLEGFSIFLLSDTQDALRAAIEATAVREFAARVSFADRFSYRRRPSNADHKTGNLWEFLDRRGDDFDYMLVLDADSLMSGAAIRRLVRLMDANPRLGICQTLIAGLPSRVAFTRLFQFGMRHGMRAYTLGSAWWQGPAGAYWGHNAIIRVDAFRRHCRLPRLPGRSPLGGLILSHDQVEAALMQSAGYEVRVLPDEFGSYEINPPCPPEFMRRSLRWCQGNLQYLKLVARPGWTPMARVQLVLAVLMYLSGPAWLTFVGLGLAQAATGVTGGLAAANPFGEAPSNLALWLFAMMITMVFAPKIAGLVDALADSRRRRSYGGGLRLVSAGLVEFVHGMILAPIMAITETIFIAGLAMGRGLTWRTQKRRGLGVSWEEAARRLWPQTLVGAVMLGVSALYAPALLPWLAPVALGPLLAIPFCRLVTRPTFGRALARWRFAAIPEEIDPPPVVARAMRLATLADRAERTASRRGAPQQLAAAE
ncbi:MAG: glucans biosynthesis glucosyltransferase MdoH [Salinarimonadaceae bacterium]|nr:MAG: glucans biosynthesis glucosyltransferase MdoH [Salinarimonadaceae bacterium]